MRRMSLLLNYYLKMSVLATFGVQKRAFFVITKAYVNVLNRALITERFKTPKCLVLNLSVIFTT